MRHVDSWALLPSRPDVRSWLAFVVLGLIGVYLVGATIATNTGPIAGALLPLGALIGSIGFLEAYAHARELDDAEGER